MLNTLIKTPINTPKKMEKIKMRGLLGLEAPNGMEAFSNTVNIGVSFFSWMADCSNSCLRELKIL